MLRSLRVLLIIGLFTTCLSKANADEVRKSVVKIFTSKSPPSMFKPWEVASPSEVTGSGVLIEGGRILTNAHVVEHAHQIYVQPNESSDKLDATLEFISEGCDLATLTIDEPKKIEKLKPVPLADDLPSLKDKVNVLGYPTGGDSLSVTEGVVSRIEYAAYGVDARALRIQVDAAINPGNSGGPGIIDDKITGLVFSRFSQSDGIGYLIPAEVIKHFLKDSMEDGTFDGFPLLGVSGSTLENPSMRKFLELDDETSGIVIHRIEGKNVEDLLKPWDIITACDGVDIDNLGRIPLSDGIQVSWGYLISRKPAGSTVKLDVLRDGKKLEIEAPTVTERNTVVQRMTGERPTYFVYGGIVFSPVTYELVFEGGLQLFAVAGFRGRILSTAIDRLKEYPEEELVAVCHPILPHKLMKGYEVSVASVVTHVNDVPVRNIRQMIETIKEAEGEFIVFRFENEREEKIVLERNEVEKYQSEMLRNNNIPSACSGDLKDICP